MSMQTNLRGRLSNTSLPIRNGLCPLYEAVVNSMHAIEEAKIGTDSGEIRVEILRDKQQKLDIEKNTKRPGPEAEAKIFGFRVSDNGIGFNDVNMQSFLTLDSEHKKTKGGRGVGRLLWLKAFQLVKIKSIYFDTTNRPIEREFSFNSAMGVHNEVSKILEGDIGRKTIVDLVNFDPKYQEASYKTTQSIAKSLFEHCLWYFVRAGGAPRIIVYDELNTIDLENIYEEHMLKSAVKESVKIKNKDFYLTHIKLRANSTQSHSIAYCAANRLVKEESINGKVPGLYGNLNDESGEFIYSCYVSSPYLDDNVRSERTDFNIQESVNGLFAEFEISLSDIRESVLNQVSSHLSDYLIENRKKGQDRLETFVSKKAPRYRPLLSRIASTKVAIDPTMSDRDLELTLHKQLAEVEEELLVEGHDIIASIDQDSFPEYQAKLEAYLKKAEDIKRSDLASYISKRRVILDLLEKALQKNNDGNYVHEETIHKLIMPMRIDSNQVISDSCNLWLIDERLAFHEYLASDKTLVSMPITNSRETKEPDLCALKVFNNPMLTSENKSMPLASIVVVEIKRPMRNDAREGEDKDPIEQALGYLERIRKGGVQTPQGRPIKGSENIPGFCYVICDLTNSIEDRCRIHDAINTSDGQGYFFYNRSFNAYVEIISFDGLIKAAKERNRAFFDKLGLPTS
ncbi:MAG: ATP-binding protein [Candidatus Zixiibacteriota bacterium]